MSMQEGNGDARVSTVVGSLRDAKKTENAKLENILKPLVLNMICSLRVLLKFAIYLTDCFLQGLGFVRMPDDGDCFFHALTHQIQIWRKRKRAGSQYHIGALIGLLDHFNATNTVHILVNLDAQDMKSLRKIAATYIRENPDSFKDFLDTPLEVITYNWIHLCGILNLAL
jgi:hypothetical protein